MADTCSGTTKAGKPCRMVPTSNGLCVNHSPAHRDRLEAARKRGGRNRSPTRIDPRDVKLRSIEDVLRLSEWAAMLALSGDAKRTHALVPVLRLALEVLSQGVVEERLEELEAELRRANMRRIA